MLLCGETSGKSEIFARLDGTLEEIRKMELKPITFVINSNMRSQLDSLANISNQSLSTICRDMINLGIDVVMNELDEETKAKFYEEYKRSITEITEKQEAE